MSTKAMNDYIGRAGLIKLGSLQFAVVVKDVKQSYGKTRFLVEPANGQGSDWKDAEGIELTEPAN